VVDRSFRKSAGGALDAALAACRGDVVGVFEVGDRVRPGLLRAVDATLAATGAVALQTGVRLVDGRSRWFSLRHAVDRYLWYRSRLHWHAERGFVPLEATGAFVRTGTLRELGGWDERVTAPGCELGLRLSVAGAPVAVADDPSLATLVAAPPALVPCQATFARFTASQGRRCWRVAQRETRRTAQTLRCGDDEDAASGVPGRREARPMSPDTALGDVVRDETRRIQGLLEAARRGAWRRLPTRRQRVRARATLAQPLVQAVAGVAVPVAAVAAIALGAPAPVLVAMLAPVVPAVVGLVVDVAALSDRGRTSGDPVRVRDHLRLVAGAVPYRALLAVAAVRAVAAASSTVLAPEVGVSTTGSGARTPSGVVDLSSRRRAAGAPEPEAVPANVPAKR
jgi:hypothetical protein